MVRKRNVTTSSQVGNNFNSFYKYKRKGALLMDGFLPTLHRLSVPGSTRVLTRACIVVGRPCVCVRARMGAHIATVHSSRPTRTHWHASSHCRRFGPYTNQPILVLVVRSINLGFLKSIRSHGELVDSMSKKFILN